MGSVPIGLAADLKDGLSWTAPPRRGPTSGTAPGRSWTCSRPWSRSSFRSRCTGGRARRSRTRANVRLILGDSASEPAALAEERTPTFYFLDGHWSGGSTAGAERQCPVMAEIRAIGRGHPSDCLVIDDARLFAAAPPPPQEPEQWPTLVEVFDAIRAIRPRTT